MAQTRERISIIGLGKLGICFALSLERAGFDVLGVDLDPAHVAAVNDRSLRSDEPGVTEALRAARRLRATTSLPEAAAFSDALYVLVATPSLPGGGYDHGQVDGVVEDLLRLGPRPAPALLAICCTTMPEYGDALQERVRGHNFEVVYNPEFIAQGTILRDQARPDMVLIGASSDPAADTVQRHHQAVTENDPVFCRMTRTEAEICKLALNCFLTTKISFANMIGDICVRAGADPDRVLGAVGTDSRVSPRYLAFGYGYGGPCFPRDNRSLAAYGREKGVEALVSLASDAMNEAHAGNLLARYLHDHPDRSVPVTFESVTYKPESTLLEESQQLRLAEMLARAGYRVVVREREGVVRELGRRFGELFTYEVRP